MFSRFMVGAVLVISVFFARASAEARLSQAAEGLQQSISTALDKEEQLKGRIRVSLRGGDVVLSGRVPSVWARNKAIELALAVEGVKEVISELEIATAESDEALGQVITDEILRYAFYTIYDYVEVRVEKGVVVLKGRVTWGHKVDDIERRVSKVLGVQEVVNELRVLPTSINDDNLRATLTRRIYGDPLFIEYTTRRLPPIHIIVENGRVTLIGRVRSLVEKRQAEQIARSTFGVFSVESQLTTGS